MRLRSELRRAYTDGAFVRSSITSALATGSDFVAASLLHLGGARAAIATFLGCVVGGVVAFGLNRVWAFRARDGHTGAQLARFLFVWAASAVLNAIGVDLLLLAPGLVFGVAWILVRGGVYACWNYPMLRWFVFARPRERVRAPSSV